MKSDGMTREQQLAWTLVLESMIYGNHGVAAKAIVAMAAQSEGSVEWYAWPDIFGDLALETLLEDSDRTSSQDERLAISTAAEFGAMLESTEGQFVNVIAEARGQVKATGERSQIAVDRELWRCLAVCAVLAREQSLTAVDVLRRAEERLAEEGN